MNELDKRRYNEIYSKVADDLDLPVEVVKGAYEGYWLFARTYVKSLPLKNPDLTEEEFVKLRASVNFPSLGKLAYPLYKFKSIKLRNLYQNNQEDDSQSN